MSTSIAAASIAVARRRPAVTVLVPVAPPRGRFSTGIERLDQTAANRRVGSFCDGMRLLPDGEATARVGRFSTGIERLRATPAASRVGSFAEGYDRIGGR